MIILSNKMDSNFFFFVFVAKDNKNCCLLKHRHRYIIDPMFRKCIDHHNLYRILLHEELSKTVEPYR